MSGQKRRRAKLVYFLSSVHNFVNFDFFSIPSASAATTEGTELEMTIVMPLLCHGTEKRKKIRMNTYPRAKIVGDLGILARNTSGTIAPHVNRCDFDSFAVFQLWRFNSPSPSW